MREERKRKQKTQLRVVAGQCVQRERHAGVVVWCAVSEAGRCGVVVWRGGNIVVGKRE